MRCVLARPTKHLIWRIRTLALILSLIFVFGASSALARGGGHGGGGHGGGGHGGGHSGGHGGHHGSHVGSSGHFTNQIPCAPMDKTSVDCPPFGEKQSQTIPEEKPQNRFESRFD